MSPRNKDAERIWQDIAKELSNTENGERIGQLSEELLRALERETPPGQPPPLNRRPPQPVRRKSKVKIQAPGL
jgi:hypothetical protein